MIGMVDSVPGDMGAAGVMLTETTVIRTARVRCREFESWFRYSSFWM